MRRALIDLPETEARVEKLENTQQQLERSYIKLTLGLFCGAIIFVFVCWGGWHFYQAWESHHLVRRASAFLSGGDAKAATLSARRAFQLDSKNADAARVLAEAAERIGDASALDWRRKVQELDPHSVDDRLALVQCAIQFGDLATAEKTLGEFSAAETKRADYEAAAARLAEAKKNLPGAITHWQKAVELAPQDQFFQLELATAQLASTDASERDHGRDSMQQLRHSAKWDAAATRALIIDGISNQRDPEQLRDLARNLRAYPKASFSDRMLCLEVLRELKDPDFISALSQTEKDAALKLNELTTLLSWMNKNHMSLLAIDFVKSLPPAQLKQWPIPFMLAEAYAQVADWPAIERLTKDSTWENFEFLRHACVARALRGEGKEEAAREEWSVAMKQAAGNRDSLAALSRTVIDWGWQNEAVETLWGLTRFPEKQTEALHTLYLRYTNATDMLGLYRVLSRLSEVEPGDFDVKNNLAQISMLLRVDPEFSRDLAQQVYQHNPSNPAYATTYAFSLFQNRDAKGAVRIMQNLTPAQLSDPTVSAYYGIFLAAAGDSAKAKEFLHRGEGAKLLPEESALVEQAKGRISLLDAAAAAGQ